MDSVPPAKNNKIVNVSAIPHGDWHALILYSTDSLFKLFDTDDRNTVVAICQSAKNLSKFAWANGAISIKHSYNLKLAES